MRKGEDKMLDRVNILSKSLPSTSVLLGLLFLLSAGTGIASVALVNNVTQPLPVHFPIVLAGVLTGVLVVLLPTILTIFMIRAVKRYIKIKHLIVIASISAVSYSVFLILASALYLITGNFSLANAVVLAGDAGIFGWWFFVSKVVFGLRKGAVFFAAIQPLINILIYVAASGYVFTFAVPLGILIVKLFAGIIVFAIASYMILYLFEGPIKRNLGFGGVDAFSQLVQNWLFDIDVSVTKPLSGQQMGTKEDIGTHTLVFKNKSGKIKTIMFTPDIHYGPMGTIGGSNFPYLLEKYATAKYKATALIMHSAVNEDHNPASSSQYNELRVTLDKTIAECARAPGKAAARYTFSRHRTCTVSALGMGKVQLVTFTRAPYVTEDISPEAATLFEALLNSGGQDSILIDAHNSRYETAPEDDLRGVHPSSKYLQDYIAAVKGLGKAGKTAKSLRMGSAHVDAFTALGSPVDLAPGNLNVVIFAFNGFRHCMVQFNANNMLPKIREDVRSHIRKKYGMDAEVYTTDTHFVNSFQKPESNVLGRVTSSVKLKPLVDKAIVQALADIEPVDVYYKKHVMRNFMVWGPDVREKAFASLNSVISVARILVPTIIVGGFVIASWIISWI